MSVTRGGTDGIHSAVWADRRTVNAYGDRNAYLDPGEERILQSLADEMRGQPVLDIGVGAGRTVPLLTAISSRYVGIDYSADMVQIARRLHPGVDLRHGDARHLAGFEDGSMALVVFSHNGIDCVDHEGRQQVLREVHRVLRPGGVFVFSTLNKDGFGRWARPWRSELRWRDLASTRRLPRALRTLARLPRWTFNLLRNRRLWTDADGWCMAPIAAHDYRLVMHYTTLAHALEELAHAGFAPDPVAFESGHGEPVRPSDDTRHVYWFQIAARKPPAQR